MATSCVLTVKRKSGKQGVNTMFDRSNDPGKVKVMRYIEWYLGLYGKSPAIRAICRGTALTSTDTVHGILKQLAAEGYITLNPKQGRGGNSGIMLTNKRFFEHVETTKKDD